MALSKEQKSEVVSKFGASAQDTGSAQVQVALLTNAIEDLTKHCQQHPKDASSRRGLLKMVCNRRKFLKYLSCTDNTSYKSVIQRLGLRK